MQGQLSLDDYRRYGRQMILDGFGLQGMSYHTEYSKHLTGIPSTGQLKLQASSVVVVGAGGLGCPALQYLAAAGFGETPRYRALRSTSNDTQEESALSTTTSSSYPTSKDRSCTAKPQWAYTRLYLRRRP